MQSNRLIIRGAALSGAAMVVAMAGQLGAAMIFTRVLPGTDVGIYLLLILAAEFFIMLGNCGLWTALPKLVGAARDDERPSLIGSVLAFQGLTALGLSAVLILFRLLIREPAVISDNPSWLGVHPYLWALAAFVLFGITRENAMASLAGLNRYGRRAAGLIMTARFASSVPADMHDATVRMRTNPGITGGAGTSWISISPLRIRSCFMVAVQRLYRLRAEIIHAPSKSNRFSPTRSYARRIPPHGSVRSRGNCACREGFSCAFYVQALPARGSGNRNGRRR